MKDSKVFDNAPLPAPPAPTRSKGLKTLMTCGCGCAVLMLLTAIGGYLGLRYFLGPGDQIPTDHMLGEDTVFVMHMDALSQDVGAKELAVELVQVVGKIDPADLAPEDREAFEELLDGIKDFGTEDVEEIISFLPSSMTLIAEDNGTELTKSFGINLSSGSRGLKWLIKSHAMDRAWTTHDHEGFEIWEASSESSADESEPDNGFIGFQHDTLLLSNNQEALQWLLDRTAYEDEPGPPAESELRLHLEQLRKRWLISCVLRDSPRLDLATTFAEALSSVENPLTPAELDWLNTPFSHATTGIGFVGADMTVRIEISGLTKEDVAEVAAGFEQLGDRLSATLGEQDLELLFEVIQGSSSLAINANLLSLQAWVEEQLKSDLKDGQPLGDGKTSEGGD